MIRNRCYDFRINQINKLKNNLAMLKKGYIMRVFRTKMFVRNVERKMVKTTNED